MFCWSHNRDGVSGLITLIDKREIYLQQQTLPRLMHPGLDTPHYHLKKQDQTSLYSWTAFWCYLDRELTGIHAVLLHFLYSYLLKSIVCSKIRPPPPPTPLLQTFTNKKSKNTSGIFYSPWTDETFSFSVIATHLLASVFRTASCSLSVTAVDYTPSTVRAEENCSRNRMTSWLQHGRALFLKVTSCCYC